MGSGELNDADNPAMYNHPIQEGAGGGGGAGGMGGWGEEKILPVASFYRNSTISFGSTGQSWLICRSRLYLYTRHKSCFNRQDINPEPNSQNTCTPTTMTLLKRQGTFKYQKGF